MSFLCRHLRKTLNFEISPPPSNKPKNSFLPLGAYSRISVLLSTPNDTNLKERKRCWIGKAILKNYFYKSFLEADSIAFCFNIDMF